MPGFHSREGRIRIRGKGRTHLTKTHRNFLLPVCGSRAITQEVVMRRELPLRSNLEHLKSQAKDLLHAFQRKDVEALRRFREELPVARGAADAELAAMPLALHDAQSIIAREYGCPSWADLRAHVDNGAPTAETLRAFMRGASLPDEVQQAVLRAAGAESPKQVRLPSSLPLLPLRNAMLAPGATAPLNVQRPRAG
jgi:hypothetical protein